MVFCTYRGHAMYLAKGGDLKAMVAEMYGKATGCTKGKGGAMHLIDPEAGVMGTSAVVGTTIANAVGCAYAMKLRRQDRAWWSASSATAPARKACSTKASISPSSRSCRSCSSARTTATPFTRTSRSGKGCAEHLTSRARASGMPAELITTTTCLAQCTSGPPRAVDAACERHGDRPVFLRVPDFRWSEHVGPNEDFHLGYRTKEGRSPGSTTTR